MFSQITRSVLTVVCGYLFATTFNDYVMFAAAAETAGGTYTQYAYACMWGGGWREGHYMCVREREGEGYYMCV